MLAWTRQLPPGQLQSLAPQPMGNGSVTLHRLGLFGNVDFSLQQTLNVLEFLHKRHGFAGVWGHYLFPAGFLAVLIAETLRIPATVSARGNDVDLLMFPPGDFARLMWTLERAKVVTAVSRELAAKMDVLVGHDLGVEVTGNTVDSETFSPGPAEPELRAQLGIAPDEAVLGFCGELRQKKGLPFLLSGLEHVRSQRPACLLVIGEVRAREESLLSSFQADAPESARRIVVTGHLEDPREVARHLRLCDVFLQPSVWDGLPNAVLEAMACQKVVIASDAGGIPEAIRHGVEGFIVPRAELHRLGEGILEILNLPAAERTRIGEAARARMLRDFHGEAEEKALRVVLERLSIHVSHRH